MLGDVMGLFVYDVCIGEFDFCVGLVFIYIFFVDEINWILLKMQVVLFEVMEECQVLVDGVSCVLFDLFLVVVMQNLIEYEGIYFLFEVQFDWFLMKLVVGMLECDVEVLVF